MTLVFWRVFLRGEQSQAIEAVDLRALGMADSSRGSAVLNRRHLWVPNSQSIRCMVCREMFSTFTRWRHHCRQCGILICQSCSRNRHNDSRQGSSIRTCKVCFAGAWLSTKHPAQKRAVRFRPREAVLTVSNLQPINEAARGGAAAIDEALSRIGQRAMIVGMADVHPSNPMLDSFTVVFDDKPSTFRRRAKYIIRAKAESSRQVSKSHSQQMAVANLQERFPDAPADEIVAGLQASRHHGGRAALLLKEKGYEEASRTKQDDSPESIPAGEQVLTVRNVQQLRELEGDFRRTETDIARALCSIGELGTIVTREQAHRSDPSMDIYLVSLFDGGVTIRRRAKYLLSLSALTSADNNADGSLGSWESTYRAFLDEEMTGATERVRTQMERAEEKARNDVAEEVRLAEESSEESRCVAVGDA